MYVVEHDGRMVLIDCGITFPKNDQMGVDIVLPDFSYVVERRDALEALILTHGHEDHIGAVPFLLRAVGQVPIYARRFTLALLRSKLDEHRLLDGAELVEVAYNRRSPSAPSSAEFMPAHPQHAGLRRGRARPARAARSCTPATSASSTARRGPPQRPAGPGAAGRPRRSPAARRLHERGGGPTASPLPIRDVRDELVRIFATANGRVLVTTFSSHIHRVQQVLDAAYADGRVVALVGRSLTRNVGIASNLIDPETGRRYLTPRPGTLVRLKDLETRPRDEQVLICTGSQGEPMAALSRIARGEHNHVPARAGRHDHLLVEHGPRQRAGGERDRQPSGAGRRALHHRAAEPARPRLGPRQRQRPAADAGAAAPAAFAPIHGEARHQRAHAELAEALDISPDRVHVVDNGDVLEIADGGAGIVDRVHAGLTYVDQAGGGDVTESVLRDRRHLADDGLVMIIARVDAADGTTEGEVEIVTRGFGSETDLELKEEIRLTVERSLESSAEKRVTEVGVLQHQLHDVVASLVRKRTQQRPMIVPVVVEV